MARLYDGAKPFKTEGVALALVNPAASAGRAGRWWPRIEPTVRVTFPGLEVCFTQGPGDAERIAREWAEPRSAELRALIVAGGDGTLHEAVNGLFATAADISLGLIPLGSGNDFARNLEIPLDPEAAASRLQQPTLRHVDLAAAGFAGSPPRLFLNSLSFGVSAAANRLARAFPWIRSGRLRYTLAGVLAIWARRPRKYLVRSAERVLLDGPALNVTVANGASFGGGMRISPDSSPTDGVLELIVLAPMGRLRALAALARLQRGAHLTMPEIRVIPIREPLRLEAGQDGTVFEADGEVLETKGALEIQLLPRRLLLLN